MDTAREDAAYGSSVRVLALLVTLNVRVDFECYVIDFVIRNLPDDKNR